MQLLNANGLIYFSLQFQLALANGYKNEFLEQGRVSGSKENERTSVVFTLQKFVFINQNVQWFDQSWIFLFAAISMVPTTRGDMASSKTSF